MTADKSSNKVKPEPVKKVEPAKVENKQPLVVNKVNVPEQIKLLSERVDKIESMFGIAK